MAVSVRRVLHVIDTGGPGGAETVYLDVLDGLDPARWHSFGAVPDEGWIFRELKARGIDPIVMPAGGSFNRGYARQLRNVITEHRIDLVQAHLFGPSIYASMVGALCGVPVVSTFHGAVDVSANDRFTSIKFRIIRYGSERIVFVSAPLAQAFQSRYSLDPSRVAVIENAIDTEEFAPRPDTSLRRELGIADDILVGAVGNLRSAKRYDIFLRAAAQLVHASGKYQFVVFGHWHGELDPTLVELQRQLGLEHKVKFLGFRSNMAALMNNLDVYLLTSDSEGFSLSTVQAMACGVPPVATRCGGPESIITDGVNGLLVDAGDVHGITNAVELLRGDRELRTRIGNAARGTAATRFALEKQRADYAALYESVLRSYRRRGAPAKQLLLRLVAGRPLARRT